MKKYFKIEYPAQGYYAEIGEGEGHYKPMCRQCGYLESKRPLSIKFMDSRPLGDFSWLTNIVVTERCKKILEQHNLNLSFSRPVIKSARQENVWDLEVLDKCKSASECGIKLISKCALCGYEIYSTWKNGLEIDDKCIADFFCLYEFPGIKIISERVKEAILEEKLTNIDLIPIDKFVDKFAWMRPFPKD